MPSCSAGSSPLAAPHRRHRSAAAGAARPASAPASVPPPRAHWCRAGCTPRMPRAFAASRSIVLTPTPIFWISRSLGAAAIISAVQRFSTCHSTSRRPAAARASSASSSSGQTVMRSSGMRAETRREIRARRVVEQDVHGGSPAPRGRRWKQPQAFSGRPTATVPAPPPPANRARAAQRLLDAQRLVPLRHALAAREAADLELADAPADREMHDRRVLGLARAGRDDAGEAGLLRRLPGLQRLGQRAALVGLQQHRVGGAAQRRLAHARRLR